MAVLLRADGSHERHPEAKLAIEDFMRNYGVEWLTLSKRPVEASETPWLHENLESPLDDGESYDDKHFDTDSWTYTTLALVGETGRLDRLPSNKWCEALFGDILVYTSCICDYDGSQYKCSTELEINIIVELLSKGVDGVCADIRMFRRHARYR